MQSSGLLQPQFGYRRCRIVYDLAKTVGGGYRISTSPSTERLREGRSTASVPHFTWSHHINSSHHSHLYTHAEIFDVSTVGHLFTTQAIITLMHHGCLVESIFWPCFPLRCCRKSWVGNACIRQPRIMRIVKVRQKRKGCSVTDLMHSQSEYSTILFLNSSVHQHKEAVAQCRG